MGLSEIRPLPFAQLTRVLNRLLEPRYLRAYLVITALDGRDVITLLGMKRPLLLDCSLRCTLIGERRLHRELAFAHCAIVHFGAAVQITQLQCKQLGGQAPLLLLERLVATRRRSL